MAKTGFFQENTVVEETGTSLSETNSSSANNDDKPKSSFYARNQEYEEVASGASFLADAEAAAAAAEAAQAAAEAAQAAAETAETNAETAETNAETAETNAAASASAASASASAASTSASAASTSASNAATSESNASTSASAAATSASAASTSASAAASSATSAATSYDNFDDRYLGDKAADPTLDNDGDALLDGALYFNTTSNEMKVYDLGNTTWITIPVTNFLTLTDTPSSYAGSSLLAVRVNAGETALEFAAFPAGYTDEEAQDAVGGILVDSSRIDFTYADATPSITADLIADSVDNTFLANMAAASVKGRAVGAGTGDPTDLTGAQVLAIIEATTPLLSEAEASAAYQPLDADLTTWAGLTPSANAQSLVTAANYAAMRALLDLEAGTDFYSISAADAAFQPKDADLTSWAAITRAAGFDTFVATPSSANLSSLLTDEAFSMSDAELGALAGLTSAADKLPYFTGSGTAALADLSSAMRTFMTTPSSANLASLVSDDAFSLADAELGAIAGLVSAADRLPYFTGSGTASLATFTATGRSIVDDASVAAVGQTLFGADPNADRIIFWDDSAGAFTYLTPGDGLAITTTTIAVTIDANTEAAIESAIDTLANLTSIQGFTVTFSDAGADAIFGWDDSANAWEALTSAEAFAVIKSDADAVYQPLDADLTSIAALTTAAAGRSLLTLADPNLDAIPFWDDSAATTKWTALADLNTEAAPAAGDYLFLIDSGGNLLKVNWSSLPGAGGGISNVVEDVTPQLGGDLDFNGHFAYDATLTNQAQLSFYESFAWLLGDVGSFSGLEIQNNGDSASGVRLLITHNSASPAADDVNEIYIQAINSAAATFSQAIIDAYTVDTTNGSEDSKLELHISSDGADITALTLNGSNLWDGTDAHVFDCGSNQYGTLAITCSSAGNGGPELTLYHNSASPTAGDNIGQIAFYGNDNAANSSPYAYIGASIVSTTNGSEQGTLFFQLAGTASDVLTLGASSGSFVQVNVGSADYATFEIANSSSGTGGPQFYTRAQSSSPAANDDVAYWVAAGKDSAGNNQDYFSINTVIVDPTSTSEDSKALFRLISAGSSLTALTLGTTLSDGNVGHSFDCGSTDGASLEILNTSAGTHGPELILYANSASPAAGDHLAYVIFQGKNSGASVKQYAYIEGKPSDVTAASEDGYVGFQLLVAGSDTTVFTLGNGVIVGSTSTYPGAGFITAGNTAGFWVRWTANSTTILDSFNMTSIADTAVGDADGTIANDFANANWAGFVQTEDTTTAWDNANTQGSGFNAKAAGTFGVLCSTTTDGTTAVTSLTDPDQWDVVGFGDPT